MCCRSAAISDGIFNLRANGIVVERSFTLWEYTVICSCDLDLDPMTFVYELYPYSVEIHRMCKYELSTSRLSKVIV